MHSGRNSGHWIVTMLTKYPVQCLVLVGVLATLSATIRNRSGQEESALPFSSTPPQSLITGMATVTDGDSLRIGNTKIRLWGVDAPELRQTCTRNAVFWPCGTVAKEALTDRIKNQSLSCREEDVDRYGRTVAECFVGDESLNAWLVGNGWALAYRRYSTKFVSAENKAKGQRLGLWQGEFVEPWDWRRQQR